LTWYNIIAFFPEYKLILRKGSNYYENQINTFIGLLSGDRADCGNHGRVRMWINRIVDNHTAAVI
jgi:hypothetical protein